jgi:hypothetical protein
LHQLINKRAAHQDILDPKRCFVATLGAHALMTMIAYAFLQYRRLKTAGREKKNQRAAASTVPASRASGHPRTHRSATATMPALPKMDLQHAAA